MVVEGFGHESQISLLPPPPARETIEPADEPIVAEHGQLEMHVGVPRNYPSVELATYYQSLGKVLRFFGRLNTGENFRARFREDSPFVRRYDQQHGEGQADKKFDESVEARERLEGLAHEEFAKAFGRDVLIASKIRSGRVINSSMEKYYEQFQELYAGLGNTDRKSQYLGKIQRRAARYEKAAKN